tara:strand:+ start:137 stop:514 length:378 start_codon:yes stop_codon:yes gene_type:complete
MSGQQYHQNMVHFLKKEITFADAGTTVTVGTLPANSVVLRGGVAVTVAFDGDTTNTLDIGTVADPNGFATVLALGTIGNIVADEMATSDDALVTVATAVTAAVVSTASAAAGTAYIWVEYVPLGN